jgi:uncharacterized protein YjbI with pentapeptide repeats
MAKVIERQTAGTLQIQCAMQSQAIKSISGSFKDPEMHAALVSASRRFEHQDQFIKDTQISKNRISSENLFGRFAEADALKSALRLKQYDSHTSWLLNNAVSMLLDFSMCDFTGRHLMGRDATDIPNIKVKNSSVYLNEGNFRSSVFNDAWIDGIYFLKSIFNGAIFNNSIFSFSGMINCSAIAGSFSRASFDSSALNGFDLSYSNTEDLMLSGNTINGLKFGDFASSSSRLKTPFSNIARTGMFGKFLGNNGMHTLRFLGNTLATPLQIEMLSNIRKETGTDTSDLRFLIPRDQLREL